MMSFDWKKYLELAEYIYENSGSLPDREACYRTSVSRAYYAAFCIASRYLRESDGKRYEGGDAHKKVREHLQKSGNQLQRMIGNQLQELHFKRIKADYHDNIREKPYSLASKSISEAKKIISEINELSSR
jgi:uncharacterized protein (UPF0332 family)